MAKKKHTAEYLEQARQKIEEAYGEWFGYYKNKMDEWGWAKYDEQQNYEKFPERQSKNEGTRWRPMSLFGLEDNRGWNIPEFDEQGELKGFASPYHDTKYQVITKVFKRHLTGVEHSTVVALAKAGAISHYKIWIKELLPVI